MLLLRTPLKHALTKPRPTTKSLHPRDPSSLNTVKQVLKSGFYAGNKTVPDITVNDDRMGTDLKELVELLVCNVMAAARKIGIRLPKQFRFARNVRPVENPVVGIPIRENEKTADLETANHETAFSETAIMETATQPFHQISDPRMYHGDLEGDKRNFERTEAFWKHDKDNEVIDAPKLGKLLEANKKASGSKHVEPDEVIITMLLSRSPLDVVTLLKSLREIKGMEGEADALHRRLLVILKDYPGVVSYAWMESEYLPEELFKIVRLDGTIDYDETSTFLSEWLWYIGKYSETHLPSFRVEHAVKLLFQSKGDEYVNAFFDGIKKIPGREKLADELLELYV
uniref:Uncharacterized protein n=1 Tax=Peronospora matthiolae TaxID=2874970 RepID=A0AAV1V1E5_9STRA